MATDDLAAEITLRLRAQMSGPLDEIKKLFADLKQAVKSLDTSVKTLAAQLDKLRVPTAAVTKMKEIEASAVGAATAAGETSKAMRDMRGGAVVAGARRGVGGGRHGVEGPRNAGESVDYLGGAIAGAIGLAAIRSYADFESALGHTAITEKLRGPAAMAQISKLASTLEKTALATGTSSQKLAEAEFFLVTTGMNKKTIAQMMPALAKTSTAYNVPVPQMTQAAFTLHENLGIKGAQTEIGLAMLAYASKLGHFGLGDFGLYLPGAGGKAVSLGMKGTRGEATIASALEVIRRNTGTSQGAATELGELMHYMTSPMGMRMFDQTKKMRSLLGPAGRALMEKYHIHPLNLPQYLNAERGKGVDAVNAMVDYFKPMLAKIKSPTDRSALLGLFFHNKDAQQAMLALLQYSGLFGKDQKTLMHVDPRTVNEDFKTAWGLAITQVRLFDEEMAQLERDIGKGLLPLLRGVNALAKPLITTIGDLNKTTIPGLNAGLGDLAVAAAAVYATFKAFVGISGKLLGGGAAAEGGAVAEAGAAASGVPVVRIGALGIATGAAIISQNTAGMKALQAAIDRNTHAQQGAQVAGNGEVILDGPSPVPFHAPMMHASLPRATPPRGPFLNRP